MPQTILKNLRGGYEGLVIPPLVIITAFCFTFLLIQSHKPVTNTASADTSGDKAAKAVIAPEISTESQLPVTVSSDPAGTTTTTTGTNASVSSGASVSSSPVQLPPAGGALQSAPQNTGLNLPATPQVTPPSVNDVLNNVNKTLEQTIQKASGLLHL